MELGEKIREARLKRGLSQRQLCAGQMTRNMLSQIENSSARPSMKTLEFLARQLELPVSYFLEEQAVTSPNRQAMTDARIALALEDLESLRQALDAFQEPDDVFLEEYRLLEFLWHQKKARQAMENGQQPYARTLLTRAGDMEGLYITRQLRRENRLLLALAGGDVQVEGVDEALHLLAKQAPDPRRQLEILAAAEDKTSAQWNWAQGQALFALKQYGPARDCYEKAGQTREVLQRLEICCRELKDYENAYRYACLQRED